MDVSNGYGQKICRCATHLEDLTRYVVILKKTDNYFPKTSFGMLMPSSV